jgi:hypothetical protein
MYREVNIETKEARGKAVELKQRRQMQAEKNRLRNSNLLEDYRKKLLPPKPVRSRPHDTVCTSKSFSRTRLGSLGTNVIKYGVCVSLGVPSREAVSL